MLLRVLGTAAGGGLPQWNCACPGCAGARRHPSRRRLHDSLAFHRTPTGPWFLANASPDVAEQLESHPTLRPGAGDARTPVVRVVLTDAELDHTLGLLRLREAARIEIWCTEPVRKALQISFPLGRVLAPYTELTWHHLPSGTDAPPAVVAGLEVHAVPVSSKRPRYAADEAAHPAWSSALRVRDPDSDRRAVYLPALAAWTDGLDDELAAADCVLIDGTFLDEEEPRRTGFSERSASAMGHLPVLGPTGTARRLHALGVRAHYTHLNNSNVLADPGAPEREHLAALGLDVAQDRMVIPL
ncbi:MBL fold metallo-hydrolase [Streptomyces sp. Q6]|uniref:MBL fold metallo-hydrolase n=1 Tax=Streptomyces citrinus TaxID=3118173 RepID=A0ACD5AN54_9ACTN